MSKQYKVKSLGEVLEKALEHSPLQKEIKNQRMLKQWVEIVGEDIAKISRPLYTKSNILFIGCESPVALDYLNWQKVNILKKIRKVFGKEIKSIKCLPKEEDIWYSQQK